MKLSAYQETASVSPSNSWIRRRLLFIRFLTKICCYTKWKLKNWNS